MVRIRVLQRLYNLSDEQREYPWLDRRSYQRFCGLANATHLPDRTTVWTFENRIGIAGAKARCDGVSAPWLKQGFIARGGPISDATRVPAPKQHNRKGEQEGIEPGAMPADWKPAKRRQKDIAATWTKKHGQSRFGSKLSIHVDKKSKIIRKIETDPARPTASPLTPSSTRATRAVLSMPLGAPRPRRGRPGSRRTASATPSSARASATSRGPSASGSATRASPKPARGSSTGSRPRTEGR
jgi:IS5 family transposase